MGDREVEFVANGIDEEIGKRLSLIASKQNVYFKFNVLWPEILFVCMVLNDFVLLYSKKCKHPDWDQVITSVRKMQSAVSACLQNTLTERSYARTMNLMFRPQAVKTFHFMKASLQKTER